MRIAAAAWALVALLAAQARAQPPADENWLRAETPSFTVLSNAPRERTIEVARRLEELNSVVGRLHGGGMANAPVPTKIFVFRDDDSFAPYKPLHKGRPAPVSGYFQSGPYGNVVAIDGGRRRGSTEVIYHEYLHAFANHNFPGAPLWFEEGLAELYSNFEIDGESAMIGRAKGEHVACLRQNRLIPMHELLAIDRGSELYDERRRQGIFYAQSWALVHYFLAGDETRRSQLGTYLDLVSRDRAPQLLRGEAAEETLDRDAAFRRAFDLSYRELERELEEYVERGSFGVFRVRLDAPPNEAWVRLDYVSRAEVLYQLGDLLVQQRPARESEARRHLEAALALEPTHPGARTTLGLLAEGSGDLAAAIGLFESAAELAPEDALPRFHLGRVLLRTAVERIDRSGETGSDDLQLVAAARRILEQSRRLDPSFGPVYAILGYTYLFDRPPLAEGLDVLLEARRRVPGRTDVLVHLAVLAARLGRIEGARRLVDELVAQTPDPELLEAARFELAKAELEVAVRLLEEGRIPAALALAEEVLVRSAGPVAPQVDEMVERLRVAAGELLLVQRYNRALELAQEGSYEEALDEVRGVATATTDPELEERAVRIEVELRRLLGDTVTAPRP